MTHRSIVSTSLGLVMAAGLASAAMAQSVAPADQRLDLGRQQGDLYAVVESDGMHVVATFAEPAYAAAPVRIETVLAPNQTVTLSSPRSPGEPADAVTITRHGNAVQVQKQPAID